MTDLSQEEWSKQLGKDSEAVILDVRTTEEVEEGYIPGAVHIDIYGGQEFLDGVDTLDKSKNYYVYCRSGNRSTQACILMNQRGFSNTYNLTGGFSDWKGEIIE